MSRLAWTDVSVSLPKRGRKASKTLLHNVHGHVEAGELLAIMGPSGSGKTTLLNVLAHREPPAHANVQVSIFSDGREAAGADIKQRARFVEANDVLIGSLTVRETLRFAVELSLPASLSQAERSNRVDELLQAFGLWQQADTIVGSLVRKGISTGQKRRLSVASMLTSAPDILFLDEPTSGLDSSASLKVMTYIQNAARVHGFAVICSIHQPSTSTFELFDKLLVLSEGQMCFFGAVSQVKPYFESIGHPLPLYCNPADYILDLVNIDFERDTNDARVTLSAIHTAYETHALASTAKLETVEKCSPGDSSSGEGAVVALKSRNSGLRRGIVTVFHRSWIKSRRDILVYGIRFGMYLGLAIMMGTVWLRLPPKQENIQPYANCILFGSAFMSFMAVVYVPAFVEDRLVYIKDRANGLYGSTAFMLSNFLIGLPYLFGIAMASSLFTYWMVNFRPDGNAFMVWVMWMYLNLVAAESLVVLVACLVPNFVGALALTAMANGIWMACNGFMVAPPDLNVFWRYVFYYINYQGYVFRGLITNEFGYRNYDCNEQCYCSIDTPLRTECQVQGSGVLAQYGFTVSPQGKWVGITIGIIVTLRLLGWAAMEFRR